MVLIRGPWPERDPPKEPVNEAEAEYDAARPGIRYFDDPKHIRRFDHRPPKGLPSKLVENVEVAGVSHEPWRQNIEMYMRGREHGLALERDPDNAIDPNSIKVIGIWRDAESGEIRRLQIGWVPGPLARMIAEAVPDKRLGATLRVMFLPRQGYSPGLRFDIWQPRGGKRLWYERRP
jgi:hypothetical protein